MKTVRLLLPVFGMLTALFVANVQAEEFAPYGTAKVNMHEYPTINAVFDANIIK